MKEYKVGDRVTVTVTGVVRKRWIDDSLCVAYETDAHFGAWDLDKADEVRPAEPVSE